MTVKEILADLVAIDTVRDNNNEEIMGYLKNYLEKYDFDVELQRSDKTGKYVLIGKNAANPKIGFLGHTDTVDVTAKWQTDPFTLTEKDGMLYGLGACDMKGGIAAVLKAIDEIDSELLKKGVGVYFTYDEEVLFRGIEDMIRNEVPFPEHMVVCEPTEMGPGTLSKGLLEIKLCFYGETTHSSTPIAGKNSNKNAVKFMNSMLQFEEELKETKMDCFDVEYTTMNIGVIKGGTTTVKVPDYTEVWIDFRIIDNDTQYELILKTVKDALLESCNGDGSLFDMEITCDIPSFVNQKSELAKMISDETGVESSRLNGITEASYLKGDRVIIGPGPLTAHEKDEHVSAEDLEKLVKIYSKIIEKYA